MFEIFRSLRESESGSPAEADYVIVFVRRSVIIDFTGGQGRLPSWGMLKDYLPETTSWMGAGSLNGRRCLAFECDELPDLPSGLRECPIRQFLFEYPAAWQEALCRAKILLSWRRQHRFCGGCCEELQPSDNDSGLRCPRCGNVYYPQLSPAVIVAVTRNGGRELLLAHNKNFAGNMYSLIAGFVEAGESAEAAIHREIAEECGIQVKNLQYITSQVWPFPNSLMLAFTAEYASGTAKADGEELSDSGWFTAENHPELPSHGSVARTVIDLVFGINQ